MLKLWVIISILSVLIDIFTSAFILFCFAIGGIAAIVLMTFGYNIYFQIAAFTVVSIVSIAIFYPLTRKLLKKSIKKVPRMEESYIGKTETAMQDITDKAVIKINGIYWTVKNTGEEIYKNDKYTITGIEGNKFLIKKFKEE